ncbi:MAG: hypothetical protein CM1200mP2_46010 [Planctomycetaceae bacterium]|nr:MAG: hypothetical protein CM1200mP2_46010 [Planctomycetaceae bacterium]
MPITTMLVKRSPGFEPPGEPQDLLEDLGSREIAVQSKQSAGTEDASHGTSDLCADAGGPPPRFSHQHALDLLTVDQFHQQFLGPVSGDLVLDDLPGEQIEFVGELFSKLGWQVGHVRDRLGTTSEDPLPDLSSPVGRLVTSGEPIGDLIVGESAQGLASREDRERGVGERVGGGHCGKVYDGVGSSTVADCPR